MKRSMLMGLVLFILAAFCGPALAADNCDLARRIGKTAAKKFKQDKKEGLRLFIKALGFCPQDARLNYNLGLAYFRYGNLEQAHHYLERAVTEDAQNALALNLLAWVMLQNRSDPQKALSFAQKAARLAPDSSPAADTLLQALMVNGKLEEAVLSGRNHLKRWPDEATIKNGYVAAVDAYVDHYLKLAEGGQKEQALKGLARIDFDPMVARAYCWTLFAAGKTDAALTEAYRAQNKFKGDQTLGDIFDQIMDRFIQAQYGQFKAGRRAQAATAVKAMLNKYPGHPGLKTADDKIFNAILAEADTIDVPAPMAAAQAPGQNRGQGASRLNRLQEGTATPAGEAQLLVDVDRNIPPGKLKKPDAIAVIIGNGNYHTYGHNIPDVAYAHRDAAYMKEYVVHVLGYKEENVIYERDVTQGQLTRIFGRQGNPRGQLYNFVKAGKSEVFVYYSGHGAPDAEGRGAFIMPVDADAEYIANNGFALDTLYANLAKVRAKRVVVVLDTCFSGDSAGGALMKNVSPGVWKSATPAGQVANGIVFSSTSKGQISNWFTEKRHSLFTYFFLKGLQGAADGDGDKSISVAEMNRYLSENVPYRARRISGREQQPVVVADNPQWELARLR